MHQACKPKRSSPARRIVASIQIIVLVVLRPLGGELKRHAFVGELIEPDALADGQSSLESAALVTGRGGSARLSTQFPAGIHEGVIRLRRLKDPDQTELLGPEAEAGLDLEHLHKRFLLGLVVHGHALALPAAGHEDLQTEVAEGGIPGGLLDGRLGAGLRLVEAGKDVLRLLAYLLAFLLRLRLLFLVVLRVGRQGGCGGQEGDREDQQTYRRNTHLVCSSLRGQSTVKLRIRDAVEYGWPSPLCSLSASCPCLRPRPDSRCR